MKIKTKKQLTLPQLIKWAGDNDIKHRVFESNPNFDGLTYELGFDIDGDLYFEEPLAPTLLFTVEVEEEITEDTKLFLVERYIDNEGNSEYHKYKESSIKNAIENNPSYYETTHFYIENDDRELILIWRDGKLVE